MISEGTEAPGFELPGLVEGEHRRVALDEFVGDDVVILAFYPGDFNPACDFESDLDELDLFTMQKDVEVLAVGPDTLYSHEAFASEYDLHIPLLSDGGREVAETYGVVFEDEVGQHLVERAVFVIDHGGEIQYAWSTRDVEEPPRGDEVKDAIADTGGDDTAFARYRVGHAHYTEGRRAFTSAMGSYREGDWMLAQSGFKRAREEFEEAADHFDSAVRFVDDETFGVYYDRSQQKATALWQAADWLSKSASEYSSGHGAEAQRLRDDAENPLETARDIGEPIDPDDWPPDPDAEDERDGILPETDDSDATLSFDPDEPVAGDGDDGFWTGDGDDAPTADEGDQGAGGDGGEDEIDDAELEEIEAELAASQPENPEGEELEETPTSMVDAPPGADDGDGSGDEGDEQTAGATSGSAESDGDIDGEVGEAELEALQAELAANEPDDDGETDTDESDGDPFGAEDAGATDDPSPPADPDADLASGSGGGAPGTSRSLEPAGGGPDGDLASDRADDDPAPDDEPKGASDEDLADIPTAEELEGESDGEEASDG